MFKLKPKTRQELFNLVKLHNEEKQIQTLNDEKFALREAVINQTKLVAQTFIDEYHLSEYHATIIDKPTDESRVLYHSSGVIKRDIQEIYENLIGGILYPGRFSRNQAGIAIYWGNNTFFESTPQGYEPSEVIEAFVDPSAKIKYVSQEDYENFNLEEYKEYFDETDYNLLMYVEKNWLIHTRSIFDVAMGYDACYTKKSTGVEIWAIYNRSILELEKHAIKQFDSIFPSNHIIKR